MAQGWEAPSCPVLLPLAVAGHEADDLFQLLAQFMLPTRDFSVQSSENLGEEGPRTGLTGRGQLLPGEALSP